ncbi:hypothetical protein BFJ69_g16063 [Fusarium oxysporum]|nr:hypothetical protein BFJ65_g4266 [Fusarium oxysporum f. sp. cepae]RKK27429.1 hypothetical protein BFJ67_g16126 [Fusarium oxysporum f. sp. cepae]RKK41003.1 hypothetical protein BFJ66_g11232 [Fusarium oxysporum f. sp. cepae]RKK65690.1 hypothetical protein BFJ69_g16063 [Fusarium oxysporum]
MTLTTQSTTTQRPQEAYPKAQSNDNAKTATLQPRAPVHMPVSKLFTIHGRTAICTGVTGGIGIELCVALAEAGADIVSIQLPRDPAGPRLQKMITGLGRSFKSFECDIADSSSLRACFIDIWAAGVQPAILLNAAGVNQRGAMEDLTDDDIDKVFAINLKASFVTCQEFAKKLFELGRPGKIVNIGSMTSFIGMFNVSAYASSKGGVLQMTKAFSNELAPRGIQVNCICPGYFKTPLTEPLVKDKSYNDFIMSRTPAMRWGEPKDLRGALIFLASPASDFVTGVPIIVDGGMLGK